MKKNFKKAAASALLIPALLLGGLTGSSIAAPPAAPPGVEAQQGHHGPKMHFGGFVRGPVHEQAYLLGLVKTYTPDSLSQWEAAFAERKQVMEDFKAKFPPPDPQTKQKGDKGKGQKGDKQKPDTPPADVTERIALAKAFADAVQASDAAAIAQALPKLLADFQSETAKIKEFLATATTDTTQKPPRFRHFPLAQGPVHEQAYLTTLVKTYTPDSLSQWQTAFAERKQVLEDLKAKFPPPEGKAGEGPKGDRPKGDHPKGDHPKGDRPHGDKGHQPPPSGDVTLPPEVAARIALEKEFTDAVKASDATAIAQVLPKLLTEYQAETAKLKTILENGFTPNAKNGKTKGQGQSKGGIKTGAS